jgi:hypothetical protein
MACDDLKRKNEKLHYEIDEIHKEMLTLRNSLVETAEERDVQGIGCTWDFKKR